MNKVIKGVLVDVEEGNIAVTETEDTLKEYYSMLNCDIIDIVERKIGGKTYSIVCDDEGLLKDKPRATARDEDNNPVLVGSIFITNSENTPDGVVLSSLTDEDIQTIMRKARFLLLTDEVIPYISDVEY